MITDKRIIQMLPDYIRGKLSEEERLIIENQIKSSDSLKHEKEKCEQYVKLLQTLNSEQVNDNFLELVHQKIETKKKSIFGLPKVSLEIGGLLVAVTLIIVLYNPFSEYFISHTNSYITKEFTAPDPVIHSPAIEQQEKQYSIVDTNGAVLQKKSEVEKNVVSAKKTERRSTGTEGVKKQESTVAVKREAPAPAAVPSASVSEILTEPAPEPLPIQTEDKKYAENEDMMQKPYSNSEPVDTKVSIKWIVNAIDADVAASSSANLETDENEKVYRSKRNERKQKTNVASMDAEKESFAGYEQMSESYLLSAINMCGGTYQKIDTHGVTVYSIQIASAKISRFIESLQSRGRVVGKIQETSDDLNTMYTIELTIQ